MKATLAVLLSLTLLACGGSSASVGAEMLGPAPTASSSPQQPDAQLKGAPEQDASNPSDAGVDSSQLVDSSTPVDAGVDAADSGIIIEPPPPPVARFGVDFTGGAGQTLQTDFPAGLAGQTQVTLEGYFSTRQLGAEGRLFYTPSAYCALVTTGAYTGHVACCPNQSAGGCLYSNAVTPLNQYLHVAYVLDAGRWTLYIDGALQATMLSPYVSFPAPNVGGKVIFGAIAGASPFMTVDEFRASATARYTAPFAPPAHLDADASARLTLLLDEGAGSASGPAVLIGCSWVPVAR